MHQKIVLLVAGTVCGCRRFLVSPFLFGKALMTDSLAALFCYLCVSQDSIRIALFLVIRGHFTSILGSKLYGQDYHKTCIIIQNLSAL